MAGAVHCPPTSQACLAGCRTHSHITDKIEAPSGKRPVPPQEKPSGDPSAPSPVPGPSVSGESGPTAPGPEPGGAAPQGHTVRTPAFSANAHRLLPWATPLGGRVGMGLGIASGGPGRTTTLAAPSHAAAAPRDTSPISAGSQRCRATVRPPKAPGLPAGLARAFRALNVPVPGSSDLRAQRPCSPLCAASLSSTTTRCILGPASVLVPLQSIRSVPNTPAFQSPTATNLPEFPHLRNPVDLACEGPLPCLAPTLPG